MPFLLLAAAFVATPAAALPPGFVWMGEPNQPDAFYAKALAGAGDVNADGYADIIVGATLYEGPIQGGGAAVYYGSPTGPAAAPSWVSQGPPAPGVNTHFGEGVAGAGDVNGDGYDDVIIGARAHSNPESMEGGAFVYHGSPTGLGATPAWAVESDQAWAFMGRGVDSAGDVNADGYDDVIVGADKYDGAIDNEGAAHVYLGGPTGLASAPAWTAYGADPYAYLGYSVAGAGDVNGDGYDDILVGAYTYTHHGFKEGAAAVYLGTASGVSATPVWFSAGQDQSRYGEDVAGAGDVNGDGYDDILVGAYGYSIGGPFGEGAAFLYLGSPSGPEPVPAWYAEGGQASSGFGGEVAGAGDVNGDGYDDVLVGAASYNSPLTDEGQIRLYLGSPAGLSWTPAASVASGQARGLLEEVAGAGDTNGDGYDDVLAGALNYSNGQAREGAAWLWFGRATAP